MSQLQLELFHDCGSHKVCRLCLSPLSKQSHRNRRTKMYGLCYLCLHDFEVAGTWNPDTFIKSANRRTQLAKRSARHQRRIHHFRHK